MKTRARRCSDLLLRKYRSRRRGVRGRRKERGRWVVSQGTADVVTLLPRPRRLRAATPSTAGTRAQPVHPLPPRGAELVFGLQLGELGFGHVGPEGALVHIALPGFCPEPLLVAPHLGGPGVELLEDLLPAPALSSRADGRAGQRGIVAAVERAVCDRVELGKGSGRLGRGWTERKVRQLRLLGGRVCRPAAAD
eukprot:scaffold4654_cov112-Isochrysis_galbana.AAC.1